MIKECSALLGAPGWAILVMFTAGTMIILAIIMMVQNYRSSQVVASKEGHDTGNVKIVNAKNPHIIGNRFSGSKTLLDVRDSEGLHMKGNKFDEKK